MRWPAVSVIVLVGAHAAALDVRISANLESSPRPAVLGKTNLPDGMSLLVGVRARQKKFFGQAHAVVNGGVFRAGPFGSAEAPLAPGPYSVEISSPLPPLQPREVRSIIGANGEQLHGKLVRKSFGANVVSHKTAVTLRDGAPTEFRGMKWGAPPKAALEPVGPATDGLQVWKKKVASEFLGIPVKEETYFFVRKKLYGGAIYLDGEPSFASARQRLAAAYGRSASSNAVSDTWRWYGITVMARYDSKSQQTTVQYENEKVK